MPKADTQFKPGVSGNPAGRPKDPLLAALKRKMTPQQAADLMGVLLAKALEGDMRALEMVWDRLAGKVVAREEHGAPGAFSRGFEIRLIRVDETTDGNDEARSA